MPEVYIHFIGVGDREHRFNSMCNWLTQHSFRCRLMRNWVRVANHLRPYFPGVSKVIMNICTILHGSTHPGDPLDRRMKIHPSI